MPDPALPASLTLERQELFKLGEDLRFPLLWYVRTEARAEAVGHGREAWLAFCQKAGTGRIDLALQAARARE